MASDLKLPVLNNLWATYRSWAETARYYKGIIDVWSERTLYLALCGAALAALDEQLRPMSAKYADLQILFKAPGLLSALFIALAAYFTSQMLSSDNEKFWVRARSAAESLKSLVYLYRASVTPDDTLKTRIDAILDQVKDIVPRQAVQKPIPSPSPLTVDGYIAERVVDQVTWYNKRALEFQTKADRFGYAVIALGVASVVLGVVTTYLPVSPWVAVIATATTAVTAYVKNRKYQDLIALYSSTATRLSIQQSTWISSGKSDSDKADRDKFIQSCEETMSAENGSWNAQWSKPQ